MNDMDELDGDPGQGWLEGSNERRRERDSLEPGAEAEVVVEADVARFRREVERRSLGLLDDEVDNLEIPETAEVVVAVLAVTPFVQAVATHFGNRLAGAIDEATSRAIGRFLRGEVSPQESSPADEATSRHLRRILGRYRSQDPVAVEAPISDLQLRSERGWQVKIDVSLPVQAIAQLPVLHEAEAPDLLESPTPQLLWDGRQWLLIGVGPQGEILLQRWDAGSETWAAVG
ncbi:MULTISPECIES: hypothetical protein [unclassified Streptomyces]|uniref:hypothetical protein n=1 Tax=unclassified Streptomyces TaxID=2593676 RepID=UPI002259CC4E|nr:MULTISPECIES: hypothetical protein [unclassified Streptomyces]MCX5328047.1 hypothetical protein [Streptomyces sp. NBC_00140]MCX5357544.1 hypothetical protein [Streptomyces sp. NBC_00124]